MKEYDPTHRDYQIRDKHYLEQELTLIKIRREYKLKIRRLYIAGFLTFVLLVVLYLCLNK
jgi:hypothetical protein